MKENKRIHHSKGFTLIEIIAVLIILGVLAAVAVPKYTSLVNESREKALDGALSVGYTHVSLEYSKKLLELGEVPSISDLSPDYPTGSSYSYTFTPTGGTAGYVVVEVSDEFSNTRSGTWTAPK